MCANASFLSRVENGSIGGLDLRNLVEKRCHEHGLPALAAAVVRSDGVDATAVGVRALGNAASVALDDRFHIGSNTKAMTATIIATHVEDDLISWDAGAAEVLGIDGGRTVTLEQLLSHTGGIRSLTEDDEVAALPTERAAAAAVLLREPAAASDYSNGGYVIAAAMLEEVAGSQWEELLRARLFEPLDMNAGMGWPPLVSGHYGEGAESRLHDRGDGYRIPTVIAPAGDVNTSIRSYGEFLRLHLRGLRGEPALLHSETITKLHTPVAHGRALGWGRQEFEGAATSVHAGSGGTFYAVMVVQPERDIAVAVVANSAGERAQRGVVQLTRELVRIHGA